MLDCPLHDDLREKFSGRFRDDCRMLLHLVDFDQDYTRLARFLTLFGNGEF
jgi:hypothetical protein